ncbi:MAG: RAD52 family DNA repair protein [Candidatus Bipolaricaulia bacterium]
MTDKQLDLETQQKQGTNTPNPGPSLSEAQIQELKKPLDERRVEKRQAKFGMVQYLPTYDIIERANEIFGFGGWQREIIRLEQVYEEEGEGFHNVAYLCESRIRVGDIVHEDVGFGSAIHYSEVASAHEKAVKSSVSDSLKRCFRAFGSQFGLSLYRSGDRKKVEEVEESPPPSQPARATKDQLSKLQNELSTYELTEDQLIEYVNTKMESNFTGLEELSIQVTSRVIERFTQEKKQFADEILKVIQETDSAPF